MDSSSKSNSANARPFNILTTFAAVVVGFSFGATISLSNRVSVATSMDEQGRHLAMSSIVNGVKNNNQRDYVLREVSAGGYVPREMRDSLRASKANNNVERQLQSQNPAAQQPLQLLLPQQTGNKKARTPQDLQHCRDDVFTAQVSPVPAIVLERTCNEPGTHRYDVCRDLADFTGLSMEEVMVRMSRVKQFHFEEEHLFWNPQTNSELAWYYSTSQSYLFANAVHAARTLALSYLKPGVHEPVLDYSGGVGNSVLYLALERGMTCRYFGIGMMEKSFAEFRVAKRGLQDKITFMSPWTADTNWAFDPLNGPLPGDSSLGSILATDVLEHIPNYHHVVKAMVDSLKIGGVILEVTPFAETTVGTDQADVRIHVSNGGVSMKDAMGERMVFREKESYWEKIKA